MWWGEQHEFRWYVGDCSSINSHARSQIAQAVDTCTCKPTCVSALACRRDSKSKPNPKKQEEEITQTTQPARQTPTTTYLASDSPKSSMDEPRTLSCVGVNPAALPAPLLSLDSARRKRENVFDFVPAPITHLAVLNERGREEDVTAAAPPCRNAALPAPNVEKTTRRINIFL